MRRFVPAALVLLLLVGCTTAATHPPVDDAAIRAATAQYLEMLRHGTPAQLAALFTEDGEMLDGPKPVHGRAAIVTMLQPIYEKYEVLDATMTIDTIDHNGADVATVWGHYTQKPAERATHRPLGDYQGRWVATFRRSSEGWRIVRMLTQPLQGA